VPWARLAPKARGRSRYRSQDVQALTRMGCDFGQGMLHGPPLPTMKIRQMIKSRMGQKPGG